MGAAGGGDTGTEGGRGAPECHPGWVGGRERGRGTHGPLSPSNLSSAVPCFNSPPPNLGVYLPAPGSLYKILIKCLVVTYRGWDRLCGGFFTHLADPFCWQEELHREHPPGCWARRRGGGGTAGRTPPLPWVPTLSSPVHSPSPRQGRATRASGTSGSFLFKLVFFFFLG